MKTSALRLAATKADPRYASALLWGADEIDRKGLSDDVVQACYDLVSWRHKRETGCGLSVRGEQN